MKKAKNKCPVCGAGSSEKVHPSCTIRQGYRVKLLDRSLNKALGFVPNLKYRNFIVAKGVPK